MDSAQLEAARKLEASASDMALLLIRYLMTGSLPPEEVREVLGEAGVLP